MGGRYPDALAPRFLGIRLRIATALRATLRDGYNAQVFRSDALSGVVVALVAIPLGMALAIASGVAPQNGLYTVIIAGALVALLGGSRCQVTGPTAAFVVILAPIVHKFGFGGLLVAGEMAGIMLVFMGLFQFGKLIQFIPYPVTTGFTSGIAVVIGTLQLKDFLGLKVTQMPDGFFEKLHTLWQARGSLSWIEGAVGLSTLLILIYWPRINRRIPAPLVALVTVTVTTAVLHMVFSNFEIATIGSRFSYEIGGVLGHGIPCALPTFDWPWRFHSVGEQPITISFEVIQLLIPSAFAIALLGAIESLLSAVVADGMAGTKHDPNAELTALGIGNMICPFFAAIPATGAIARTATNIRYGARSPVSSMVHAVFTLAVVLLFAPLVSYIPMASLAALLMLVAYNMSERKHFVHIVKIAPKSDVLTLLACFSLTVAFDMVIGVTVGVMLAALLFMRHMADTATGTQVVELRSKGWQFDLPSGVVLYEIAGPLFFGAAEKAVTATHMIDNRIHTVIFDLTKVTAMDITGLVALESAVGNLTGKKKSVWLAGLHKQPAELLERTGLLRHDRVQHFTDFLQVMSALKNKTA